MGVLERIEKLYLVIMKFRFPPINFTWEGPLDLSFIYTHIDSSLIYADKYLELILNNEYKTSEDLLFFLNLDRKFEVITPKSIHSSRIFNIPLASVLIPIVYSKIITNGNRRTIRVSLYFDTVIPSILNVDLMEANDQKQATPVNYFKTEDPPRYFNISLRRRDNIIYLLNIVDNNELITQGLSDIHPNKRGYKSINLNLKIPYQYMTTAYAFFASVRSIDQLNNELRILEKIGIGKKRNSGYGDLISWEIYKVNNNAKFSFYDPLLLSIKENQNEKVIALRMIKADLLKMLINKNSINQNRSRLQTTSIISLKTLVSNCKPPYWLKEEICIMPYSEILIKR